MPDALVYLLGLVGLTLAITMNKHLKRVRKIFPALLECSQCLGAQLGFWSALFLYQRHSVWGLDRVLYALHYGFMVSLLSYVVFTLITKWGAP